MEGFVEKLRFSIHFSNLLTGVLNLPDGSFDFPGALFIHLQSDVEDAKVNQEEDFSKQGLGQDLSIFHMDGDKMNLNHLVSALLEGIGSMGENGEVLITQFQLEAKAGLVEGEICCPY